MIDNYNSGEHYSPELRKKTKDEIAEAYNSPPWWYDIRGFFILTFAYNSTLWHQIAFFSPQMGKNHLEVACGTGTLLKMVLLWRTISRKPNINVVGVDYAESMLAGAFKSFKRHKNVSFLHEDAGNLSLESASFDSASIANSVHCLPEIDPVFREIHRVLKDNGVFTMNALLYPNTNTLLGKISHKINTWAIKKGILVTPYTPEIIREHLKKADFTILSEAISGNCYDVIARKGIE